MDDYSVKLYARAYRDLDDIYTHIAKSLMEPSTAVRLIDELETAIFSLEQLWADSTHWSLCRQRIPSLVCKKICYHLSCAKATKRSAYHHNTIRPKQYLNRMLTTMQGSP